MGLFARKMDTAKSDANRARFDALWAATVPDPAAYTVLYGFAMDVGRMDFVIVRKTTYTYTSFVIGYRAEDPTIVMLPIDPQVQQIGEPYVLRRSEMHKAYKQKMGGSAFIVYPTSKNYMEFWTPDKNGDEKHSVYIDQPDEAAAFTAFFTGTFAT